jgi:hypothetical protein
VELCDVDATDEGGKVDAADIEGDVDATDEGGKVDAADIEGDVDAADEGGKIDAAAIDAVALLARICRALCLFSAMRCNSTADNCLIPCCVHVEVCEKTGDL